MPSFAFHQGFAGHSIRCNPYNPTQYIITASDNFGVTGSGKVYIVDAPPGAPQVAPVGCLGTSDGAFDACFSEMDANIFVVGCGDGVKFYNVGMLGADQVMPEAHMMEHQAEVSSVHWNLVTHDTLLSASWDGTAKLIAAANPAASVATFAEHTRECYDAQWSPKSASVFLTCGSDGFWKLWDIRRPQRSMMSVPGHNSDIILSVDWNKYDSNVIGTSSVDRTAKLWDLRKPQREMLALRGHEGAVRRIRFSPHARSHIMTTGHDFRVCLWDLDRPQRPLTHRYEQHREFIVGAEWNMGVPGQIATASWDGLAYFWEVGQPPVPSHMQQPPLPPAMPPPRIPNPNIRKKPVGPMGPNGPMPQPPLPPMPMPPGKMGMGKLPMRPGGGGGGPALPLPPAPR